MPETKLSEARTTPRFSFIAEAEMTVSRDGTRVVARISKLSSRGCYVDMVNPFSMDTELRIRIRYGCSTCEMPGKVIYTHSGYGMGVVFSEIPPQNRGILDAWLNEIARKSA